MEEPAALNVEAGKENEQTLANLCPAEKATSKDEVEIEKFLQAQKSKNTQYKTKNDLKAWKKFCESIKESRAIENIPANELDLLLSKFFISVRKQDGTDYEPRTLSGFQRSFQRHLHEKGSLINILKDNEFSKSREVLAAKRKNLVRQGKGNRPNATRELTEAKKMHFLKMASSVFRILNHYKGLCGGFFPSISAGGREMRTVSCVGVM